MNLKIARMRKGLNQRELAEIIGCDPALISQYEHKKRRPSINTAKKLGAVLDVKWSDFYEDENEDDEREFDKILELTK